MRNFQEKSNGSKFLQSWPFLVCLFVVILFFAWNVFIFWQKMEDTNKNKKIAEDKVAQLQKQKDTISADINSLNTDQGKEKLFRENFGLAKDGESMIVIVDDQSPQPTPPESKLSGFFSFFKNIFK